MSRDTAAAVEELREAFDTLRKRVAPRRRMFSGLCSLCGEACGVKNRYCHGCSWMEDRAVEEWESVARTG